MTHSRTLRPTLISASVSAILSGASLGIVSPVHAQAAAAEEAPLLEEVRVTGSRILRRDFEAPSPIVTIDAELFENQSAVGLEASLNKLPQFTPAVTQFVTADVQPTATNTPGASSVSLRGLGSNRNLVLLDGRRAMPVNASMVVDVNSIPSAAIERVEIITGGASSVYGADAVGGVVNFILKRNFSGVQFDAQYGKTELGDGSELRVSALLGGDLANGRGNMMFGLEHSRRGSANQVDRDFYLGRMADPGVPGSATFYSDTAYVPDFLNAPSQTVVNGLFNQAAANSVARTSYFFANTDGSVYTGPETFFNIGSEPDGRYRYNGQLDNTFRKVANTGLIAENELDSLVSIPLERYAMFGRGHLDLTDNIRVFAQGTYNTNRTSSLLGPSAAIIQWAATIPHGNGIYAPSLAADGSTVRAYQSGGNLGLNCPATGGCTNSQAFPVPTELGLLLDSRANANASWTLHQTLDFIGSRSSENDSKNYQIMTGFEGELPGLDWTWDISASHGETDVETGIDGVASRERYRTVVASPNYGRSFFRAGSLGVPTVSCESGLPIFSEFEVSADCFDVITADLQTNTHLEQNVVEANLQGGLLKLPAGEARFALGAAYRDNKFSYQTDILNSQASFLDTVIGLFPAGDSNGKISAKEAYVEFLVPVVGDLPGIRSFDLELGYRHSDYNTVGDVGTYKILADWIIIDSLRLRGGHQKASRAPNIGELFLNRTQQVGGVSAFGDFCSTASLAPTGANPAVNPNAAAARAICEALMGPTGAATFYGTTAATAPGGQITNAIGNPDLDVETAKTWTAGFVFQSPFQSPLLSRIRASLDYYSIKITDSIGLTGFDTVYSTCLGLQGNPNSDPTTPACQAILRDPSNGTLAGVDISYNNQGYLETAGYDLQFDWRADLADMGMQSVPGSISVNFLINYLDTFQTQATSAAPRIEWKDTNGPTDVGLNAGAYEYKAFTTLGYSTGSVGMSLRWRYLPEIRAAAAATVPTTPIQGYPAYSIFDLSANWSFHDQVSVRFGVDNLFDKEPPVGNRNPTVALNGGAFNTAPGYYDVLGRRYYVGLRAQF